MSHPIPKNQHYKPSIFYLSLYLLVIILSELIFSQAFHQPLPRIPLAKPASSWKTYTSDKLHLSFSRPVSWDIQETASQITFIEPNVAHGFTIQIISNQPEPQKLIDTWSQSAFYKVNPDSSIKIGPLKTLELLDNVSNSDHNQFSLYALHGSEILNVTFLSNNPARTAAITRILSSIRFTDPPLPSPSPSPGRITLQDSGKTLNYPIAGRFVISLDKNNYPLSHMVVCPQISLVSNLSLNGPENYPVGYQADTPGICRIKNGDFSVTIKIVN